MTFKYQIIQLYIWGREMQRFDNFKKKNPNKLHSLSEKKD